MADKYFGSHEVLGRDERVKSSSNRSFGYVMAVFCVLVAGLSWFQAGQHWGWWLATGAAFGLTGLLNPHWLGPLNRGWTKLGLVLGAVISPIVMALVFYGCITPIGWLMRLTGKDPLRLRYEPDAKSYWIRRDPPGPAPDTLKNQF